MIVYLSGKMYGRPDRGKKQFDEAEERLKQMGHIVLNPANLPQGMPEDCYMPICLAMVDAADAIYLLNGFNDSPGARLESEYAGYMRKKIVYEFYEVWDEET